MSRKFRVNASRKPVKCNMSDEEFYTRDFPSVAAGKVVVKPQRGNWTVFIGLSDGTIAYQWCESKEKAQREAKYARDTIKRYGADDSYWAEEGYKIWNPNVKSSTRPANRKSTVKAAWMSHGKNAKIRSTYKTDDNYMMFEVGDDFIGISVNNSWPNGEAWISTHVVTCDDAEALFNYVKDAMEQHPEWSVITALKKSGYKYKITSFPGMGSSDAARKVGASTRSAKRKSTIKASAKTDLTKKLSNLYNDYMAIDDDKALKRAGMTLAEYNALPDVFERLQKNGHANTFMTGLANYFKKFGFSVSLDGTDYEITASRSTKRKSTIKASDESQRFVARQRTALDGKTWWCVFDTKDNKWSTKMNHGKYKTKKECEYAISNEIESAKSVKCSARPAKRKTTIKADALSDFRKDWTERIFDKNYPSEKIEVHFKDGRAAQYTAAVLDRMMSDPDIDYIIDAMTGELLYESEHGEVRSAVKCSARPAKRKSTIKADTAPYNFSRDDRYALAGEVLYRAGIANNEHGAAVAYYMPGDYVLTFNHEQNEMQSSDLIFTLWNPNAEHENDFAGILYVDLNSAQSGEDATEVFYRPNGLGSLGEWKQFDDFKSAVDWLIANAPDRESFRVGSSQEVECSADLSDGSYYLYAYDVNGEDVDTASATTVDGLIERLDYMFEVDEADTVDLYIGDPDSSEPWVITRDQYYSDLLERLDEIGVLKDSSVESSTSSTKIQGASDDNALAIFWNGQFVYRNELGREFADQLEYIFERDEDALAAAIEYLNSFGDPLIDDPAATPKEVAEMMTEWIGMEWSDYGEDFGVDISTASGILEIYPASQTIDLGLAESGEDIDASTEDDTLSDITCATGYFADDLNNENDKKILATLCESIKTKYGGKQIGNDGSIGVTDVKETPVSYVFYVDFDFDGDLTLLRGGPDVTLHIEAPKNNRTHKFNVFKDADMQETLTIPISGCRPALERIIDDILSANSDNIVTM